MASLRTLACIMKRVRLAIEKVHTYDVHQARRKEGAPCMRRAMACGGVVAPTLPSLHAAAEGCV